MKTHFGFAEQMAAVQNGWLQGRYHSEGGDTVADLLSFKSVFEINPFEVGGRHAQERRVYASRKKDVESLLDIRPLMRRPFTSLSNGEMRRVLFARALLKCTDRLVLDDDPFDGIDADYRSRMRTVIGALRNRGIEVVTGARTAFVPPPACAGDAPAAASAAPPHPAATVLDMRHVTISFGKRVLFKDFSWTIHEGERWLLTGPNGSGKTTLLALITGDAPRSYAFHITVFGSRRGEEGCPLADVRAKIGVVSAERQFYLGETPEMQLAAAFAKRPRLLLLDEPCFNLQPATARRLLNKLSSWLHANPRTAAICVAHRPEHVPEGFTHRLTLPVGPGGETATVGQDDVNHGLGR